MNSSGRAHHFKAKVVRLNPAFLVLLLPLLILAFILIGVVLAGASVLGARRRLKGSRSEGSVSIEGAARERARSTAKPAGEIIDAEYTLVK